MNTQRQSSHKELEARLTTILSIAHGVGENRHPLNHQILVSKCMTAIQDYTNQAVAAAQQNTVRWAVMVLDELHNASSSSNEVDRTYKAAKNALRDRYKATTGIDPAPSYPIHAELENEHE